MNTFVEIVIYHLLNDPFNNQIHLMESASNMLNRIYCFFLKKCNNVGVLPIIINHCVLSISIDKNDFVTPFNR